MKAPGVDVITSSTELLLVSLILLLWEEKKRLE